MSDEEKPMEAEPSSKKRKADELTEITETDGGDDKDTGDIDKSADPVKTTDAAEDSAGDGVTPTTKEDAVSSKEVNVEEEKKQNDDNTADKGEIREEKPTEKLPPKVEDAASAKSKNPYDSLKWIVVTNDGKPDSLIKLVALKSLFSKQLPKMPRPYIARLVFDRRHTSLAILSDDPALKDCDEEVIGSICYRAFPEMRFAEIAFCAVNASHQVKASNKS